VVTPLRSSGVAREKEESERGPRGSYLGPWSGWEGGEAIWPRERAAAGTRVRGGGAKGAEEELWRRWWLVVAKGDAEGPFIARVGRWSGGGRSVPAGERREAA